MEQASSTTKTQSALTRVQLAIALGCDFAIIGTALLFRSTTSVYSVWDALPSTVFGLFFISTFLLVRVYVQNQAREAFLQKFTALAHIGTWTGLAVILSPFGFGFDQVIHQASEVFLRTHGWIGLSSPLYIGQYAMVSFLSMVLGVGVRAIDAVLAPVLFLSASVALAWSMRVRAPWLLITILLPFTLLSFGIASVPWHLAMSFAILAFAGIHRGSVRGRWFASACAVFALLIHPLAGIPVAWLIVGEWMQSKNRRMRFWIPFLGVCASFLMCFGWFVMRGQAVFVGHHGSSWVEALRALFAHPYAERLGWNLVSLMYVILFFWPWVLLGVGAYGLKRFASARASTHIGVLVGILFCAFILSGSIRFSDIVPAEQFEFALRLWRLAYVWVLPGVILVAPRIFEKKFGTWSIAYTLCVAFLTIPAWYFLYPQHNFVATSQASSISKREIDVVHSIKRHTARNSYVVLASQLVSAAWIHEEGFGRTIRIDGKRVNAYAIPTGGELYELYLRLWDGGAGSVIGEAFARTDAEAVVVVVPSTETEIIRNLEYAQGERRDDVDGYTILTFFRQR